MKNTLIKFNKSQTAKSVKYLIDCIGVIANHDNLPVDVQEMIDKLSIVLAVMRKCHECAPEEKL